MGVHGLTTYLRENQRILSTSLTFPSGQDALISIVVDGWSFIYDLYRNSNLPWVYGGEYSEFCKLVEAVVQAWLKVGLKIYFVFDGASPELKFPTLVSRLGQSHIQPALLFFRTSPTSRGAHRFLNETRIIPPLAYTACVSALLGISSTTDTVELHFADEEGDPYAVELAGKIGGYVVGNDSDFVVLNTEGYRGYIPLEEMLWYAPIPAETASHEEEDSGFQEVRKSKAKKKPAVDLSVGMGIIPPENTDTLTLSFPVYKPDLLAAHLKIPVTLLPLLGALVGNDFSKDSEPGRSNLQSLFFDRKLSLSQRINRVASTIQTILSPVAPKRKKPKHQVGSVMDLIDRTVNALLARLTTALGSGEVDSIVERVVEATLQYAIPRREEDTLETSSTPRVCALHGLDTCTLLPFLSRKVVVEEDLFESEEDEAFKDPVILRALYLGAYRQGQLAPKLVDILGSGTFWPRLFLENPDLETVSRSIGRPIREWVYSILHDSLGLPELSQKESDEKESESSEEDDEDELIDVVESDSDDADDPLAPLKGELHRLRGPEDEGPGTSITSSSPPHQYKPPIVTEYLRRGTRVAQEPVNVSLLHDLLHSISITGTTQPISTPLPLRPSDERFTIFLRILGSDIPLVRALPSSQILSVLAIRWILQRLHTRAEETKSKEREKERWTKREVSCFLASFNWSASESPIAEAQEPIPIHDRNVQLIAQAMHALESIEHLAQVLLLTEAVSSSVHLLSGRAFHAYLTHTGALAQPNISPLFAATAFGLEATLGEDRYTKKKKSTKEAMSGSNINIKKPHSSALFHLLENVPP